MRIWAPNSGALVHGMHGPRGPDRYESWDFTQQRASGKHYGTPRGPRRWQDGWWGRCGCLTMVAETLRHRGDIEELENGGRKRGEEVMEESEDPG